MAVRSAPCALALAVIALAATACDARPGPVMRSSDVTQVSPARVDSCVPASDAAARARVPASWRVRGGESLRDIAKRVYGDERFAAEIARANPGRVGRDGTLRAGSDLVLPSDVR